LKECDDREAHAWERHFDAMTWGEELTNDTMVDRQIRARGVTDERVLAAMRRVDRALFVPASLRGEAYCDCALPVSHGQTISQPYIVGLMTGLLAPLESDKVLEVGTGTGYQTAILAELAREVWTLEVVPDLAASARRRLDEMGYANIRFADGDGWAGLPTEAPFDAIIVTAAPDRVPEALLSQLAPGGRLVIPVGIGEQELYVHTRRADGSIDQRAAGGVRFVPMIHPGAKG
jgi:protein-L-isoaspartate(D-aspartate) O-methyltransferase